MCLEKGSEYFGSSAVCATIPISLYTHSRPEEFLALFEAHIVFAHWKAVGKYKLAIYEFAYSK